MDHDRVYTGHRDGYWWLSAVGDFHVGSLLKICPEVVVAQYIAVTSYDSGSMNLSEAQIQEGWVNRNRITYIPPRDTVQGLEYQSDGDDNPGFDEWYVFTEFRDLGDRHEGSPFDFEPGPGRVHALINTLAFKLHEPDSQILVDLFWNQMEQIQPETYLGDGSESFNLATKRQDVFDRVVSYLLRQGWNHLPTAGSATHPVA